LIFGSLVAAALPLAVGATSIAGAFLVLRVVGSVTDVSLFAINIITLLGFGLAIDYSLFVVSRFREELEVQAGSIRGALVRTLQTAGHTVLFSGLTVIISLLSLMLFAPMFVRTMGFGAAVAVGIAVVAALTVLPATLAILGTRVNGVSIRRRRAGGPAAASASSHPGFWHATSQFVMRHPVAVLLITLVPLLAVGLPFLRIQFAVFDARSLPASHEARAVDELLRQQFPRNETQPIEVVVQSSQPVLDATSLDALYAYAQRLVAVPGVRRVDSLVSLDPRLDARGYASMYSPAGLAQNALAAQAVVRFAGEPASHTTVLSVLYDSEPYSPDSQHLVRSIRDLPVPGGLQVRVGGEPAYLVDFLASLGNTVPLAFGTIIAAMFVLLFLMLGSLVVPLKAVVLTALSLTFSFGALVWVFQDGHLAGLLKFTPVGSIDGAMPVLVFAGLFGLSMDYEVFLLSRIKEDYDRTGDLPAAVAAGLQKTGSIITSAALLLVVVTASFTTGEVLYVKQVGVSLCLAILADATVVRTLLVPATMRLMNRYNWWAPAPLQAIYHRLHAGAAA
jgi:RND superfamily putative drug exporter